MSPSSRKKKQPTFFVDTRTTCFLCLKDIKPKPPAVPIIDLARDDDDDVVELEMADNNKEVVGKKEKQEPFSLRNIFKLFQLDPGRVLSEKLTTGSFLGSNLANMDLSVVLCKPCLQVSTQLSNAFSDWEVIQMKLNIAVETFSEILQNSEQDPNYMTQLQRKLLDPLALLQGKIADLIRKETLNSCSEHVKKMGPRLNMVSANKTVPSETVTVITSAPVVVAPAPAKVVTKEATNVIQEPDHTTSTEYNCYLCEKSCQTFKGLSEHMRSRHQESVSSTKAKRFLSHLPKHKCNACGGRFQLKSSVLRHKKLHCKFRPGAPKKAAPQKITPVEIQEFAPPKITLTTSATLNELLSTIKVENEDELIMCGLCPTENTNEKFTGEQDQIKQHIFSRHLNYFFASVKLPECSEDKFRELCETLLRNELLSSIENQAETEGGVVFNCSHCPNKYHDKWAMFIHMVEDHINIYSCKLMELQCNSTEAAVKPQDDDNTCGPSGITTLSTNETNATSETSQNERYKCHGCKRVYAVYSSYRRHKKSNRCCGTGTPASSSTTTTTTDDAPPIVSQSQPFRCDDCGKVCKSQSSVWCHKKFDCPKRAEAPKSTTEHPYLSSDTVHGNSEYFRCKKCGQQYASKNSVLRHSKLNCPYRNSEPPPELGNTPNPGTPVPVTPPEIIFSPTIASNLASAPTESVAAYCPDCGKNIGSGGSMRNHRNRHCPYRSRESQSKNDTSSVESCSSVYKCQDCEAEYYRHSSLRMHITTCHLKRIRPDGKTSGRCECGVYFEDLNQHIKRQTCSAHPKVAETETDGSSTNKTAAMNYFKFPCEYCGKVLSSRGCLTRHQKSHCSLITKQTAATAAAAAAPVVQLVDFQPALSSMEVDQQETFFHVRKEEEAVELTQGTFPKIEIMQPSHVQIFTAGQSSEGGAGVMLDSMLSGNQDMFKVQNQEVFKVENQELFKVENQELFKVENQELFKVENQELFKVENQELFKVENQECSGSFSMDPVNNVQNVESELMLMILPDNVDSLDFFEY